MGERLLAESAYSKALSIDARYSKALNGRGFNRYKMGDKQSACADFQASMVLGSQTAATNYQRVGE